MKNSIYSIILVFLLLLIFPIKANAVMEDCIVTSDGTNKCKLTKTENDPDFRYSISDISIRDNYLVLNGWAFLKGIDSYWSAKDKPNTTYRMALGVYDEKGENKIGGKFFNGSTLTQSNNIYTHTDVFKFDITCLQYVEDDGFKTKTACKNWAKKNNIVAPAHSENKKGKKHKTNIYTYVGFESKIKLKGEQSLYEYYTKNLKCNNSPSSKKTGKFTLKLFIRAPLEKSPITTYSRQLAVYNKIVSSNLIGNEKIINGSNNDIQMKISIPSAKDKDEFKTRQTVGRIKKTSDLWSTTNYHTYDVINKNGKKEKHNYYIPPYDHYPKDSDRTFELQKVAKVNSSINKTPGYKAKIHAFNFQGKIATGCKENDACGEKIVFPRAGSPRLTNGWISETWTNPAKGYSQFKVDVTKTCEPPEEPADLTCQLTSDDVPGICGKDETTSKLSVLDNELATLKEIAKDPGISKDGDDGVKENVVTGQSICRGKFQEGSEPCVGYCNEQTTLHLYGSNNFEGQQPYDVNINEIFAGQSFAIRTKEKENGKLIPTTKTVKTCVFADKLGQRYATEGEPSLKLPVAKTCAQNYYNEIKKDPLYGLKTNFTFSYDNGKSKNKEMNEEVSEGKIMFKEAKAPELLGGYQIPWVEKYLDYYSCPGENGEMTTCSRWRQRNIRPGRSASFYVVQSTVERQLYNENRYWRDVAGKIYNQRDIDDSERKTLSEMPDDTYPIDLNANSDEKNTLLKITNIFDQKTGNFVDKEYSCPYSPIPVFADDNHPGLFYYKTVDLGNLFPNKSAVAPNWEGVNDKIKKQIEQHGNSIYANQNLIARYRYNFKPSNFINLKEYNNMSPSGYFNKDIKCKVEENKKTCTSGFLESNRHNSTYIDSYFAEKGSEYNK